MSILLKLICRFSILLVKVTEDFLRNRQTDSTIHMEMEVTVITEKQNRKTMKNKERVWGNYLLPDFEN